MRVHGPVVPRKDASEGTAFFTRSQHKHVKQAQPEDTVDPTKEQPRSPDLQTTPEQGEVKAETVDRDSIEDRKFDDRPSNTSPSKGQDVKPLQPVETDEGIVVKAKRLLEAKVKK